MDNINRPVIAANDKILLAINEQHQLILYNDNYHSFDYVIDSLVDICGHSCNQATQCASIAHFNGKCQVRVGNIENLKQMQERLVECSFTVEIEQINSHINT